MIIRKVKRAGFKILFTTEPSLRFIGIFTY
jgi:hypothetical protein